MSIKLSMRSDRPARQTPHQLGGDFSVSKQQQHLLHRKGPRVVCGTMPECIYKITPYISSVRAGVFLGSFPAVAPMSGAQWLLAEVFVMITILGKGALLSQGFSHQKGKCSLQQKMLLRRASLPSKCIGQFGKRREGFQLALIPEERAPAP